MAKENQRPDSESDSDSVSEDEDLKCQRCNNVFKSRITLRRHEMRKTCWKIWYCSLCGVELACKRNLLLHEQACRNKGRKLKGRTRKPMKPKRTTESLEAEIERITYVHMYRATPWVTALPAPVPEAEKTDPQVTDPPQPEVLQEASQKFSCKCSICGKTCSTRVGKRRHEMFCKKAKLCPYCARRMKSPVFMQRHIPGCERRAIRLVTGSSNIPPSFCTDALPQLAERTPGAALNPNKNTTLLPSAMDQALAMPGEMTEERIAIVMEFEYSCHKCGKECPSVTMRLAHESQCKEILAKSIVKKQGGGKHPFKCQYCDLSKPSEDEIKVHEMGCGPRTCSFCRQVEGASWFVRRHEEACLKAKVQKTYALQMQLKRKLGKTTRLRGLSLSGVNQGPIDEEAATREFYLCGLCDQTFTTKEDCRAHTRGAHRLVPALGLPAPPGGGSEHDSGQASDTTSESLEAPPASKRPRQEPEPSLADYTDEEILAKLLERNATFVCKCGIIFRDQTLFYLHRGTHSSKDPYECSFCGHVASDWYDFTSHFYFHSKKDSAANG